MSTNLEILDDQKLYKLCKFYGEQAKKWRYKFMGLLPEVYRRKLYEKKGFNSVFEFAKKLAGLSEEQVRTILNLEKRFDDKPLLKNLLVNGEVSAHKLVRIQSIATKENEEFWASQVQILPKSALETLIKDERNLNKNETEKSIEFKNTNGLHRSLFEEKSLPGQTSRKEKYQSVNSSTLKIANSAAVSNNQLQLSDEVKQKLLELQQKGIDINQLILEMLQKRELEIAQEKEQIAEEMGGKTKTHTPMLARPEQIYTKPTRHIPVKIKKLLQKEHGNKCSIPHCPKPAETIHHTQRFALGHTHDPHYLAPLCKNHHTIAHSIDLKFQQRRTLAVL